MAEVFWFHRLLWFFKLAFKVKSQADFSFILAKRIKEVVFSFAHEIHSKVIFYERVLWLSKSWRKFGLKRDVSW